MSITHEEVIHTAKLARLRLTDMEVERFSRELARITEYMDQLNEAVRCLGDDDAPADPTDSRESLRPDIIERWFDSSLVLRAAPDTKGHLFRVPKVIG
ncbi:MAG: Asp-tRNA(Asn)/Glu-tRNA(Gln) amidotransferase subunit GatC [Candidatus Zixiibacteriota bacterium]